MKWSIKLGRWLGIDVYLHLTFLLLLGFVAVAGWVSGGSLGAALGGVIFFAALFLCVLLHEFGHALAARKYGIRTRDITLLPIGGLARLERMPDKPVQELWVALAGPTVNVVIAGGLFLGLTFSGAPVGLGVLSATEGGLLQRLLAMNIFLVLFNLLPAFPMDGGRVLRAILAMRMDYAHATRIAARIGRGMAILFAVAGLFWSPMLLFIAFFVWLGATQEAAFAEMKSGLSGACVRDAMVTKFRTLEAGDSLTDAARQMLAGAQREFPVMEKGSLVGMLGHGELIPALQSLSPLAPVSAAMRREFVTLDADAGLESVLEQAQNAPGRELAMPVLRGRSLVGIVTGENLQEYFIIRQALDKQGGIRPGPPRLPMPPPLPRPQEVRG